MVGHRLGLEALIDRHLEADPRGHVEAHGEGVEVRQLAGRQRGDAARIHAARQVGADRHVRDQLPADGLTEQAVELLHVLCVGRPLLTVAEIEVPVALRTQGSPPGVEQDPMSGAQELHAGEQGAVGEDVLEGEVLEQMWQADGGGEAVVLQQ